PSYSEFGPERTNAVRRQGMPRRRSARGASRSRKRDGRTAATHAQAAEVSQIRIRGEADAALFSISGFEDEGRVAGDIIRKLIELQMRRRQLLAVERSDD